MKGKLYVRLLADFDRDLKIIGLDDFIGLCRVSNNKEAALKSNPYISEATVSGQLLGLVDNKVVGQQTVFPVCLKAGQRSYSAIAGSGLYVHEDYRKSMLGVDLISEPENLSNDGIALGCGLSQVALPAHLMCDFIVFPMQRMMWVFKSRAVVEKKYGRSLCSRFLICLADGILFIAALALRTIVYFRTCGLTVSQVDHADVTIEDLISKDERPFACEHSAAWLNWQLKHSFSSDERSRQRLYTVKEASGQLVGFFTFKIRFHETASQRGYRNLLLGSLMEWQSADPKRLSHATLALAALLEMRKCGVDAVEICTDEEETVRSLKRFLFPQVGELNFVIRATEGSLLRGHEGWDRQENWRLRPSEGDNGLS